MSKVELYHDNFQNYKRYGIPRAQLVIADIPYNIGKKAYGSNPMWYNGGDNSNGESKFAKREFFNGDGDFNLNEYFHFCSKLLKKEPKEKNKAPCMIIFCAFEQMHMLIDIAKNENWYGSPIVSQSLQGKAAYEQKYETTPEVFNWAARQLHSIGINVSPLNIQYFLEQTTGVFGQILIPAMSPDPYDPDQNAAERLFGTMVDKLINSLTLDPAYSNDVSDNFYTQWDKLEQIAGLGENEWGDLKPGLSQADKAAAQERAKELYKKGGPMYDAKQTIKDNNMAMAEIMASETLTPEQKRDQVRALRDANVQAMLDGMRACSDFFSEYVETPPNWQRLIFGAE